MEEGSREGVTKLRIPRKWGTEILLASQLQFCRSGRFLADGLLVICTEITAFPLFLFATQKKTSLCLSSKRESGIALTRLRAEWPGARIPIRIRYLTLVQNPRTDCGAHSASGSMGTGVLSQD